jgi:hypothetical protein
LKDVVVGIEHLCVFSDILVLEVSSFAYTFLRSKINTLLAVNHLDVDLFDPLDPLHKGAKLTLDVITLSKIPSL